MGLTLTCALAARPVFSSRAEPIAAGGDLLMTPPARLLLAAVLLGSLGVLVGCRETLHSPHPQRASSTSKAQQAKKQQQQQQHQPQVHVQKPVISSHGPPPGRREQRLAQTNNGETAGPETSEEGDGLAASSSTSSPNRNASRRSYSSSSSSSTSTSGATTTPDAGPEGAQRVKVHLKGVGGNGKGGGLAAAGGTPPRGLSAWMVGQAAPLLGGDAAADAVQTLSFCLGCPDPKHEGSIGKEAALGSSSSSS